MLGGGHSRAGGGRLHNTHVTCVCVRVCGRACVRVRVHAGVVWLVWGGGGAKRGGTKGRAGKWAGKGGEVGTDLWVEVVEVEALDERQVERVKREHHDVDEHQHKDSVP